MPFNIWLAFNAAQWVWLTFRDWDPYADSYVLLLMEKLCDPGADKRWGTWVISSRVCLCMFIRSFCTRSHFLPRIQVSLYGIWWSIWWHRERWGFMVDCQWNDDGHQGQNDSLRPYHRDHLLYFNMPVLYRSASSVPVWRVPLIPSNNHILVFLLCAGSFHLIPSIMSQRQELRSRNELSCCINMSSLWRHSPPTKTILCSLLCDFWALQFLIVFPRLIRKLSPVCVSHQRKHIRRVLAITNHVKSSRTSGQKL